MVMPYGYVEAEMFSELNTYLMTVWSNYYEQTSDISVATTKVYNVYNPNDDSTDDSWGQWDYSYTHDFCVAFIVFNFTLGTSCDDACANHGVCINDQCGT